MKKVNQEIAFDKEDIIAKGRILACEWIYQKSSNKCTQFIIGFASGDLEIYQYQQAFKGQKPLRRLPFEKSNLYFLSITYHERTKNSAHGMLIIQYSERDSMQADNDEEELEEDDSGEEDRSKSGSRVPKDDKVIKDSEMNIDLNKAFTSVFIFGGKKLDEKLDLA